ncbi:MAG: glycerate kinase [Methanosarcinales archaeon]|nr:MAG: glycerate kinase [Methanosarcinales archaeon]
MMIQNKEELISNSSGDFKEVRADVLEILEYALERAQPKFAIQRTVRVKGDILWLGELPINLSEVKRIFVIGFGKASGQTAIELERVLDGRISDGVVIVKRDSAQKARKIRIITGQHPVPTMENVKATERLLEVVDEADAGDVIICLISGGGSALLTLPKRGISIEDLSKTNEVLIKSGASIDEINAVRKHLSQVKGGQLVARAHPARLVSLIISDVVGDRLDVIASGPTAPDKSTYADAVKVLRKYGLWRRVPSSVCRILESGQRGGLPETPKDDDTIFESAYNRIILSNDVMLSAAAERALECGYSPHIVQDVTGESRVEAPKQLEDALRLKTPSCLISGGETTVKVTGSGKGGPNQEFVLACVEKVAGKRIVVAAIDSDGIDGFTDVAGAMADGNSLQRATKRGLSPTKFLEDNDAYHFFKKNKDLLLTGQTGTNVNDLRLFLCF